MSTAGALRLEVGLIAPDLVVQLDCCPEALALRPGYGEQREENIEFQTRVRAAFSDLHRDANVEWSVLDASLDIQSLSEAIIDLVLNCIYVNTYLPIKKF